MQEKRNPAETRRRPSFKHNILVFILISADELLIRDLTLEITVAIAAARSLEEAAESARGSSVDQRPANATRPPRLSVSREEESGGGGVGGRGEEGRAEEEVPTSHCLRQMSMFLRCAFEKWSHAFCLVAAVKTAVICSTLG